MWQRVCVWTCSVVRVGLPTAHVTHHKDHDSNISSLSASSDSNFSLFSAVQSDPVLQTRKYWSCPGLCNKRIKWLWEVNETKTAFHVRSHQDKSSSWPSWCHSESLLLDNIIWRSANTVDSTLSAGRKPVSQHTIGPNPSVPMSTTTLRHVLLQYRTHVDWLSTCEHLIVLHSCSQTAVLSVSDVSGSAWTLLVVYMNNYINLYLFNVIFCKQFLFILGNRCIISNRAQPPGRYTWGIHCCLVLKLSHSQHFQKTWPKCSEATVVVTWWMVNGLILI